MKFLTPGRMLVIGFIFVLAGVVLPFLMIMKVIESTIFMNFFAYTLSLIGIIIGGFGASMFVKFNRHK